MKKQITKKHEQGFIRINISTDGCGESPYFSITGDIHSRESFSNGSFICGGCVHDEILEVAPELKPFVDLHLSNLDGVPMHAVENGFYWLAKAAGIPQKYAPDQSPEECFAFFCDHCRIDKSVGNLIVQYVQKSQNPRETWNKECAEMKPRWKHQAEQALKLLESL
jgi:hypothetical protein